MPIIVDAQGRREVSVEEDARQRAEAAADWNAFWAALKWRPIADFDRASRTPELLRRGEEWAIGYWGGDAGDFPGWRDAQETADDAPLAFEPEEYAALNDEWRVHLMAD